MTVTFTPRRVTFVLLSALLWACSSSDPKTPGDDSKQHVDGKAGTGGSVDGGESGGSPSGDPDEGTGNTGSVGDDDPDDEPSHGGKGGKDSGPDKPAPDEGEGGTSGDMEPTGPTEGFLRGQALVVESECAMCHTENFAGFTVFPNITPDKDTGIGSWTDEQIIAAIRDGVDADGSMLCDTMMRYPFSDEQAADVVEYLRGIPAVSNRITSDCP